MVGSADARWLWGKKQPAKDVAPLGDREHPFERVSFRFNNTTHVSAFGSRVFETFKVSRFHRPFAGDPCLGVRRVHP